MYTFLQMKEVESYIKYRNTFYIKNWSSDVGLIIDKLGQKSLDFNPIDIQIVLLRGVIVISRNKFFFSRYILHINVISLCFYWHFCIFKYITPILYILFVVLLCCLRQLLRCFFPYIWSSFVSFVGQKN
jgi:hypothetical protein